MDYQDKRFVIGIDLGTTNSAVSYTDLQDETTGRRPIKLFKVPQLTGRGEFARLPILPSFYYLPGTYDIPAEDIKIPWPNKMEGFVGALARDHGAKVPARLVSSAKSWLCHASVDRRARILPWGAADGIQKVSPVQASAAYLEHVRNAWNRSRGDDEDLYLEHQIVVLTVPASFDEVARDLTLEAAKMAGLEEVILLEEPLAAFYSWLMRYEKNWGDRVKPNELILVCDVGGGTTDFTLIALREVEGSPRFERIAVGDHLILGGDNVDLALARRTELKMHGSSRSLSSDRWKSLCHQCRQAKEMILDGRAESKKITLMGEGGSLIAGTLSTELSREELEQVVIDGFFPLVAPAESGPAPVRKGITEFGLPYEQEPAITRHLGQFLAHHQENVRQFLQREHLIPDLILFNGGSLKPLVIKERIRSSLRNWFNEEDYRLPKVLENPHPDLAVAIGAAYYGLVKAGKGVKVGSGSPRSYYLGISAAAEALQQAPAEVGQGRLAICMVERGLDEGSDIELPDKQFEVLANQPVSFDVYSSSYRSGDICGDLVAVDDSLRPLPPIQTVIQYGKKGSQKAIPVSLEASYTEMGTLALWCRSLVSQHRWKLQFQLRDQAPAADVAESEVFDAALVEESCAKIRSVFSAAADVKSAERLVKDISEIVGRSKNKWPLGFIRALADELLLLEKVRSLSPEMESRWLNLTGFSLRPGVGDAVDGQRLKAVWGLYQKGPRFAKNAQVRAEWWIFWRRVAGGLKAGQQRQFIQAVLPVLAPKKGGPKGKLPPQERIELWMAAANMERLFAKDKIQLGQALIKEVKPKKYRPQHFWALSRIGARELLYGPSDRVVPPKETQRWVEAIMRQQWKNPKPVAAAVAQIARRTGDRTRDLDEALIKEILAWLAQFDNCQADLKYLKDVIPVAKQEESVLFGESLPAGIVLHQD